jgi:16S rRNA G966 N2-methylase RsmD
MSSVTKFENLYKKDIPSTRTGIFYNLFSYPTKISPEVISLYIATHTEVGDTVLDVFGGSGTTALAAKLCEKPTDKVLELEKQFNVKAKWGSRKVIIYEIGKYGSFATQVVCNPPDSTEFKKAFNDYFKKAYMQLAWLYTVKDDSGNTGEIRHIVWSDVIKCTNCKNEVNYYDVVVKYEPLKIEKSGKCPICGKEISFDNYKYVVESVYDSLLNKKVDRKKRVPVKVYGESKGQKWTRLANEDDRRLIDECENLSYLPEDIPQNIEWGDLYRSGYHKGITHLHHFYTRRNYHVMSVLWSLTNQYPDDIANALKLLLLSYNASHSTLMTRVVAKKDSKDFVLTGAQSGVLYISSLPVEKNILKGIKRKIKNFIEAFDYVNKCKGITEVVNASSTELVMSNSSVDYVFTDPPFGDYIPYAEVNQINELWLNETTDRSKEVIISKSQNKGLDKYENMMYQVFSEINRVLKPKGMATVVFHSSKAKVWEAMCNVLNNSKFHIAQASVLNKVQGSFKQVVDSDSVQGDPMMLLTKDMMSVSNDAKGNVLLQIAEESIIKGDLDEKLIYSRYLSECLKTGEKITIDAKEAYKYIRQRIGVVS